MMHINNNNNKNWTGGRRDPGELEIHFVSVFQSGHMCDLQPVYCHHRGLNSSTLLEMFLSALTPQNDSNLV